MAREIKFRGKDIQSDEWRYGYAQFNYNKTRAQIISPLRIDISAFPGQFFHVYKDTVCQFTGLYAKNGKEIYEGDILKITDGSVICICIVTWNEEIGAWSLMLRGHTETGERPLGKWLCDNDYDIKVAGNIFDNKEILEYE